MHRYGPAVEEAGVGSHTWADGSRTTAIVPTLGAKPTRIFCIDTSPERAARTGCPTATLEWKTGGDMSCWWTGRLQ
jgi:hypothetical protein